jgi:exopolysaccharide production protein ExoY
MAFISKEISTSARDTVAVAQGELSSLKASYDASSWRQAISGRGRAALYRTFVKRAIDVTLVLASAPFWLPLVLIGAALVMLDGHNPFYSQERLGRNGRVFRIWKLRSMVPNADAFLDSYLAANPAAKDEWDAAQKLKQDPRITTVGRILRKTSLDELPQLFNVLTGDMSLVGPRPIMVNQRALYSGHRYYDMRPGLTGLWQVSDRNQCSFAGRVRFDNVYHRTMSFGTDLRILGQTVMVVLRGTGY